MYCKKCGSQIDDEAVSCPNCGCATSNYNKCGVEEIITFSTLSIVFAFLKPIVGIILGILGIIWCIKYKNPKYRNRSIAGIVISVVVWAVSYSFVMNLF